MNKNLIRICETSLMIALATVLSMVKVFEFPTGGSITLCSMLPIAMIAYRYEWKWGLLAGGVYGIVQMILGAGNLSYATSIWAVIAIILFDYIVAFGVIGFAGIFRDKFCGKQVFEAGAGAFAAGVLRFICHFISGVVVWGAWRDSYEWSKGMSVWIYSLVYNGVYMSAETIITVVMCVVLCSVFDFRTNTITALKRK